jgi:hypothetical protein
MRKEKTGLLKNITQQPKLRELENPLIYGVFAGVRGKHEHLNKQ